MEWIVRVASDIFLVAHVYFLPVKTLWRGIPAFLVVIFEVTTLLVIVRKAISLSSSSITIDGWISILVEVGSSLVNARRQADDQKFSIRESWRFIE
jgi:hypothetical protein